jgi:hypothetical protein
MPVKVSATMNDVAISAGTTDTEIGSGSFCATFGPSFDRRALAAKNNPNSTTAKITKKMRPLERLGRFSRTTLVGADVFFAVSGSVIISMAFSRLDFQSA